MFVDEVDDSEFESFQKIKKAPKVGKVPGLKKGDQEIRNARRTKERTKQAILEEADAEE